MKKLAVVLIVLFILFLAVVIVAIGLFSGSPKVAVGTILEADFHQAVLETMADDPFSQWLTDDTPTVLSIVEALEKAAADDRVKAFVARVGDPTMGAAQLQEIRDAVIAFRQSGKPAIAYADTFGELAAGNGGYYLATAFDEIYMQPSGDVGLTGLVLEAQFLRGALEKLDVEARFDHRHEYKNAMNTFTESTMTDSHREALQAIADSLFDQMVRGIAAARGLEEGRVRELFDRGPYLGQEAVDAGLVDGLAYRDQIYAKVREKAGGEGELLYLSAYRDRAGSPYDSGDKVALVYGLGGVTRGASQSAPWAGTTMGSDTVASALRAAIDDDDVRAIVFRVDSPGGSYVGSDTIWRETVRAREAGKPLIISMGNVAGSGGYFVAMAAEKIVAQPATITGSIGVLGGKFLDRELWDRFGITFDEVTTGEAATMYSAHHDYTEAQWERFQAWLDRVYDDFTRKVADGRGLPLERVQEIAKGRIWSGEAAREIGLVDELGGYRKALTLARQAAGLAADAPIRLQRFPRSKTPFEALTSDGPFNSEPTRIAIRKLLRELEPAIRLAQRLGILQESAPALSMPPVEVRY